MFICAKRMIQYGLKLHLGGSYRYHGLARHAIGWHGTGAQHYLAQLLHTLGIVRNQFGQKQ